MAENSKIEWTDHTFNPWQGCTKVSPGCDHCYAENWAKRYGMVQWGSGEPRRLTSDRNWALVEKWNKEAAHLGIRKRVFCASLADVFDNEVPPEWRTRLWELIKRTPALDWLLLTKRVGNIAKMLPENWGSGYPNVWLGISVVNQEEANRDILKLLNIPAHKRFLSLEPLLGYIDLDRLYSETRWPEGGTSYRWDSCISGEMFNEWGGFDQPHNKIDWVIVGGESGKHARPMDAAWAIRIREQCEHFKVAFFFKQGSQNNWHEFKNFDRFPARLQVRQYP